MYCPSCAAVNSDDAKFCRGCGANLSLVPQALTGELPDARTGRRHGRGKHRQPRPGEGIQRIFVGIAFILVSVALAFGPGRGWWFYMLIPAFALLGSGVADLVSAKMALSSPGARPSVPPAPRAAEMPPRNTGEMEPPPSVTEGTTRHLDATTDPYKR